MSEKSKVESEKPRRAIQAASEPAVVCSSLATFHSLLSTFDFCSTVNDNPRRAPGHPETGLGVAAVPPAVRNPADGARAAAQGPRPPPGAPGPMYQPTFANEPTPMPGPQFCPPPGGGEPPAPMSLPNDGSPNAFGEGEQNGCGGRCGWYVGVGWTMLRRE